VVQLVTLRLAHVPQGVQRALCGLFLGRDLAFLAHGLPGCRLRFRFVPK